MFGIGTGELIFILIVVILVFGPKRLPELAKTAGKFMADVKKATGDLKKNFEEEVGINSVDDLNPKRLAQRYLEGDDLIDLSPKSELNHSYVKFDDSIYDENDKDSTPGENKGSEAEKLDINGEIESEPIEKEQEEN
ncbi:MAG: twin-arginine translocase subunit TatB [Acidobacteria bacterium]|nr:twin-arginine translocase subunit TatB [Acidobacteriota bacterium]